MVCHVSRHRIAELCLQTWAFVPAILMFTVLGWSAYVVIEYIIPTTFFALILAPCLLMVLWSFLAVACTPPSSTIAPSPSTSTNLLPVVSEFPSAELASGNYAAPSLRTPIFSPTTGHAIPRSATEGTNPDPIYLVPIVEPYLGAPSSGCSNRALPPNSSSQSTTDAVGPPELMEPMQDFCKRPANSAANSYSEIDLGTTSGPSGSGLANEQAAPRRNISRGLPSPAFVSSPIAHGPEIAMTFAEILEMEPQVPVSVKGNGGRRFCRKCSVAKPDRTHHCRVCQKCILKMDHHCPWIKNCVGYHNYKFFILFLLYMVIFSAACSIFAAYVFLLDFSFGQPQATNAFSLMLVGAFTAIPLFMFLVHHLWLTAKNLTTIERMEKQRYRVLTGSSKARNPFDVGTKKNFLQVFGSNPWLWLVPIASNQGDGRHFPIALDHPVSCSSRNPSTNAILSSL